MDLTRVSDELCDDSFFGEKTWEKAEATMQRRVLRRALEQAGLKPGDVDYVLAGDLLNQSYRLLLRSAGTGHPLFRPTGPVPPWRGNWRWGMLLIDLWL